MKEKCCKYRLYSVVDPILGKKCEWVPGFVRFGFPVHSLWVERGLLSHRDSMWLSPVLARWCSFLLCGWLSWYSDGRAVFPLSITDWQISILHSCFIKGDSQAVIKGSQHPSEAHLIPGVMLCHHLTLCESTSLGVYTMYYFHTLVQDILPLELYNCRNGFGMGSFFPSCSFTWHFSTLF